MNIWENAVITLKGLALQSKLTQGHTLRITRAVTGAGYVSPALLLQQTAVQSVKQTLKFNTASYPEAGKCAIPLILTNEGLATGYTATQIGIFAEDPDEGEILYFIAQANSGYGTVVPSATEAPSYNAEWNFYFQYGQADGVNVTVDPANTINAAQAQTLIYEALMPVNEEVGKIKITANAAMPKSGGTFTGPITLSGTPTEDFHPATKQYVDLVKTTATNAATAASNAQKRADAAYQEAENAWDSSETHASNKSNPHGVTASQVGLGNVTNNKQMPIAGGTFTGNAIAYGTNRTGGCLRNIEVYNSAHSAFVSTNMIVAVRK